MKKLSVVVSCYNESAVIRIFYNEVVKELSKIDIDYELLFINDGSSDNTLEILKDLCKSNNMD